MKNISDASGFLFIGDPHVAERKPGRRKDKDFSSAILKKISQSIDLANDRNQVPVILGDLFDRPKIENESLKTRLARILMKSRHRVVCLLGNHERKNASLSDGDTIAYFAATNVIDLISESGAYGQFDFNGHRVGLGGTPYGQDIPTDVSGIFHDCNAVVWISHHDLEFEGAYPNSIPTHEIKGCKLVINGHMHLQKKPVQKGGTLWFNPGNITRQAIDAIDHIPRVYSLNGTGQLEAIELDYERDIFDLTGSFIESIIDDNLEDDDETLESAFVNLIQVESSADFAITDDGSLIREVVEAKFERDKTDNRIKSLVVGLLNEVLE